MSFLLTLPSNLVLFLTFYRNHWLCSSPSATACPCIPLLLSSSSDFHSPHLSGTRMCNFYCILRAVHPNSASSTSNSPKERLGGRWPKVKQASLARFFLLIYYSTQFLSETTTKQTNNTTGHNLTAWSETRMRFHTPSRAGTSISEAGRLQESINSRNTSSFWLEKTKTALCLPKSAYAAFF